MTGARKGGQEVRPARRRGGGRATSSDRGDASGGLLRQVARTWPDGGDESYEEEESV
jgi:hypothetical protein